MLETLCIFIVKKENRLITELKETVEGNIMFCGWGGGGGGWCSVPSTINILQSTYLPVNLCLPTWLHMATARWEPKNAKIFYSMYIFFYLITFHKWISHLNMVLWAFLLDSKTGPHCGSDTTNCNCVQDLHIFTLLLYQFLKLNVQFKKPFTPHK
jgi:hypothetical protein